MRRWRWLALLGLALLAGLARTSPVDPEKPSTIEMAGAGKIITVVPCKGNEPTIVIYGEFGVRLEDCMYITPSGARMFTKQSPAIDQPFG